MNNTLVVGTSPHIKTEESVATIMWTVVLALLPAGMFGIFLFGKNALLLIGISVAGAVLTEHLVQLFRGKKTTVFDGSAVITGLLLAYVLPPAAPWYVPLIGSVFAIAIVKMAFGGLGMNIWNPALAARAFILAAYIIPMTASWVQPHQRLTFGELYREGKKAIVVNNVDATTTATPRSAIKNEISAAKDPNWQGWEDLKADGRDKPADWLRRIHERNRTSYIDLFMGTRGGCIGETSVLLLLLGGLLLMIRGIISWHVPVAYIGSVALLSWVLPVRFPDGAAWFAGDPLFAVMSGGLMLGAFFMATDYTTTPVTKKGLLIFAAGCGLLTVIIRNYGGYPEGVNYSILLMNSVTPLIDRYIRPRKYGAAR